MPFSMYCAVVVTGAYCRTSIPTENRVQLFLDVAAAGTLAGTQSYLEAVRDLE